MRIAIDQNIPFAKEAFSAWGEVTTFLGRELRKDFIENTDILLVRSVTRVNRALLEGTSVRFVGTATAGEDHINHGDLDALGITYAHAPGSNAVGVVEYVLQVLFRECMKQGRPLESIKMGVVGCGHVGGRLIERLNALNVEVYPVDPPLADKEPDKYFYKTLGQLDDVDVVTFHVPLTLDGPHATNMFLDKDFFASLKHCPVFINASRGGIVSDKTLTWAKEENFISRLYLDVYEHEPNPFPELLERADIITPHIAGYSYNGKLRGTEMMHQAVGKFLGLAAYWNAKAILAKEAPLHLQHVDDHLESTLFEAAKLSFDMDAEHRKCLDLNEESFSKGFDQLRKNFPKRLEWSSVIIPQTKLTAKHQSTLSKVGFHIGD